MPTSGGIDPRVKSQSRLQMALGGVQVAKEGRSVIPLFADVDGYITETALSNIFFVLWDHLVTPPDAVVLGGITRQVVIELAETLEVPVVRRRIHLQEISEASEAFVTLTSVGLLPVRSVNGRPLALVPGATTRRLTEAFSRYVGVDIVAQSRAHVA